MFAQADEAKSDTKSASKGKLQKPKKPDAELSTAATTQELLTVAKFSLSTGESVIGVIIPSEKVVLVREFLSRQIGRASCRERV